MRNGTTEITIVGNLGADPELRFTPAGVAVVKFSVGVGKRVFDKASNEWKDAGTSWHNVTAWRELGEHAAETLQKGMRVIVAGELEQRSWIDEKTQETRYAWQVTASAIGPDLTFATAKVQRTTRSNQVPPDDEFANASRTRPSAPGYQDDPWNQQAPTPAMDAARERVAASAAAAGPEAPF